MKRILASIGIGLLAGLEFLYFGKCDHAWKLARKPSHLPLSPSSSPSSEVGPSVKGVGLFL